MSPPPPPPSEEICQFRATTENYTIVVAFIIIFLLSVIGNLLVLIVIVKQRAMRSIINIYLMNLAASDMMLSVVCMPPTLVSMVMNCWMFGNYMCKILAYLQPVVVTASAYTLAVIAFERYFAICKPLHSRIWQTRSHVYAMITLVWVIAIVANILMLFMYEQQTYNENGYMCAPIHPPVYHFAYQVYMTVVLLVIPLFVMMVLYGHVISSLKTGIKLEIAAVVDAAASAPTTGHLTSSRSSHNLSVGSVLVGSTSLARAASCVALYPLSSVVSSEPTPPPPSQWLVPPTTIPMNGRRRSTGVMTTGPAVMSTFPDDHKFNVWQKLSQKFNFGRNEKCSSLPASQRRKSEASVCADNPSLRSTHTQKTAMAKQRVIRMLIVVVIIFFCCWTPSYIWWLLLIAGDSFQSLNLSVWNSDINTFITLLTYLSSCTNPITYCFLNKKFRNAIYATFGRKKNIRHHFQKVYVPVNVGGAANIKEKPPMNRSVSSSFNPQHQVVFKSSRKSSIISRTMHSSLIHHNRLKKDDSDPLF
ncbi:unnamed protein product [Caenorhabditis bovis]|uniref:G-protein coupled receptors family 1 profile domain-containing protein n=1 Tax=Caenorhabditis bovis TaxID=2654633 RepID=A0A8S1EQV3_9PELO|nr:unnamed protein product [Caenorhabditis bovis]